MGRVPNLSGLSRTAAISAIQAAGLVASSSGTVGTGDSGLNDKIASQSPSSNTLVNYESAVSYTYYVYTPPACSAGWVFQYYTDGAWSSCVGNQQSATRTYYGYYQYADCSTSGTQAYSTETIYQSCSSCTVGGSCVISYSCATVGCSFCCPDPCYKSGTYNSSCACTNPVGQYFC